MKLLKIGHTFINLELVAAIELDAQLTWKGDGQERGVAFWLQGSRMWFDGDDAEALRFLLDGGFWYDQPSNVCVDVLARWQAAHQTQANGQGLAGQLADVAIRPTSQTP
jgi:hypothetical protein